MGANKFYAEDWYDGEDQDDELYYRPDRVEYLVFPEKGVVVCKIWGCARIAADRIFKYTGDWIYATWRESEYLIPNVFVGVAKCAPEDTFDEEYGKQLALVKAKSKRCKAVNSAIKKFIKKKKKDLDVLSHYGIHEVPDPKQV